MSNFEVSLNKVRKYDKFLYNFEDGNYRVVAIVVAQEELCRNQQLELEMTFVQILVNTTGVDLKPGDTVQCGQQNLICWIDQRHADPAKPDRFAGSLSPKLLKNYPYPAHLGVALMESQGYLFGGTDEIYFKENFQVPIYNIGMLIGYITYVKRDDGGVDVIINDVPNNQGNILTQSAYSMRKQ